MGKNKAIIGFILGIIVALAIGFSDIEGLAREGRICMALSFMTVIWWGFQISQPGYTSGIYLVLLTIFQVAKPALIFSTWTMSMMWIIIGAYLIAGAVKESGLGERISYMFIDKFVTNFRSIITAVFMLTFILSLLIPHPWPRAFIIMSVMAVVIKSASIPKQDAIIIGFSVFASSVPISLIFLTGDATISPLAVQSSGVPLGWMGWFQLMGPPAIVGSILCYFMVLFLFKPSQEISINKEEIRKKLKDMGPMTGKEIRTAFWVGLAILLWMTDTIHGIDIGWITLFIAMMMAMPKVGGILTPASWGGVPLHVLVFLTAAVAIGRVGGATGMNAFIAKTVLPASVPSDPLVLAAFITAASIFIHMILGSVIAVMGIVIPAMLAFTSQMEGISPLVPALLAYTAVASHYVFPFQHLNMLVGQGDDNGMYGQKECIRLGIPYIIVVFIMTCVIEVPWWKLCGLW